MGFAPIQDQFLRLNYGMSNAELRWWTRFYRLNNPVISLCLTPSVPADTWVYFLMPDSAFSLQESALSSLILNISHFSPLADTLYTRLCDGHSFATAWCTAEVLVSMKNWTY